MALTASTFTPGLGFGLSPEVSVVERRHVVVPSQPPSPGAAVSPRGWHWPTTAGPATVTGVTPVVAPILTSTSRSTSKPESAAKYASAFLRVRRRSVGGVLFAATAAARASLHVLHRLDLSAGGRMTRSRVELNQSIFSDPGPSFARLASSNTSSGLLRPSVGTGIVNRMFTTPSRRSNVPLALIFAPTMYLLETGVVSSSVAPEPPSTAFASSL
mmetsp:Transcript_3082/g.12170  ORF Transcript_3082/g.12170 Transcript_3082/m.12170 type:complete len:215 (-) Transcript_3082:1922-2566(-)